MTTAHSFQELERSISIALGELAELETQFLLSSRLQYVDISHLQDIQTKMHTLGKRMTKFRQGIK